MGDEILTLLQRVKHIFDPSDILNPNKILDEPPPNQELRFTSNRQEANFDNFFDWSSDSGLRVAAQKCNGAGVCLQRSSRGTMCPSYKATREEKHTTRGRANIFRQILEGYNPSEAMSHDHIKQVLDLCLACKGCKSECPANVDMAQMKAEFLQHYNDHHGTTLRSKVIDHFDSLCQYASILPGISKTLLTKLWLKKMLGFHPQRQLPIITDLKFSQWWRNHKPPSSINAQKDVVLILDSFTEYYEPNIAIAAVSVLESLNFNVKVTPCLPLGRVQISQGLLRHAQKRIVKAINFLHPFAEAGTALIGLEPSEILTLRDEAPLLFKDKNLRKQIETVS